MQIYFIVLEVKVKRYIKSSEESSKRFYAVTDNMGIVGYQWYVVSFDYLRKRNEFLKSDEGRIFHSMSASDAKNKLDRYVYQDLRDYINTIFDTDGNMKGMVFFDYDGNFHSVDWK